MLKIQRCSPVLLFLVLITPLGRTQTPVAAPPAAQAQHPAVSSTVDEVTLDLIVHDKKQRIIRDLKPDDLAVTDNGTAVRLTGLHLVSPNADTPHLVTFVFDDFGGPTAKSAQNVADKILKALPSRNYSFAVMDVTGRLRLMQGFTEDREAIRSAFRIVTERADSKAPELRLTATNNVVQRANSQVKDGRTITSEKAEKELIAIARTGVDSAGTRVDLTVRAHAQMLLTALELARQIRQDQHALPNLAGLLGLARSQQKVTARKCVIYFTQNMQLDSAAKEMVRTIAGAANQAGVTLYVVDMNALDVGGQHQIDSALGAQNIAFNPGPQPVAGSGGMASSVPSQQMGPSGPTSTVGMAVDWLRQSDPHPFSEIKSPLADMAKQTGGGYIDAQDSIKRPLQQMVEDLTTYYQASYVPPIQDYDGSFRTIAAKAVRSDLDIKTRTGYFAVPPGAESGTRPFEAPLLKMLAEATPVSTLKFSAAVLRFGELPDGSVGTVAVEVPISELQTTTDTHTNLFAAHVAVVAQIKDKSGTVVEHFAEDIARRSALELIDRDHAATINLERHFPASPGQYTLEVAVLDRLSEKGGVKRISFEIPPVQPAPSISDIVVVRKIDSFHPEDDPLEPLHFETGRIIPNIAGDISENTKSLSLFFVVHPDPHAKEPVTLEIEADHNGHPGHRTPLPVRSGAAGAAIPYLANFKSGLQPGDYEVKAIVTQGERTSVQQVAFTVAGQPSNAAAEESNAPASPAAETGASVPAGAPGGMLAIAPISDPVPPPTAEEIKQLLADAQERALHYVDSLPNFMCIEVTHRSVDRGGNGVWKLRDTIHELLRYRDKSESRTMLEVNGKTDQRDREGMKGTFSSGELGGVLHAVFIEKAKTEFAWKETDSLGTGTVQVFDYRVAQPNSVFSVVGFNNRQIIVGFHGQVFIDSATRSIRRVTLIADNLPKQFPTHYTSMAVDYDYVAINAHDYLMPVSAELRLQQGRHEAVLNTMEFRNYRRYGSSMRMVGGVTPIENQ